jgi:hypothetical protein
VLNTEKVINSIVTVGERDVVFNSSPSRMSAAPNMACSFHASGRMINGTDAMMAARARSPKAADPRLDKALDGTADPLMRATSALHRGTPIGALVA